MSKSLQALNFAPSEFSDGCHAAGLVSMKDGRFPPKGIAERIAVERAGLIEGTDTKKNIPIDFIFFRRFNDGRSSQVAAYILDNSDNQYTENQIAELHYRIWLSGSAPLLYVDWPTKVDILRCATTPDFWNHDKNELEYTPAETLQDASDISVAIDKAKIDRFSAFSLSNGTFWDDPKNEDWACADKAAHQSLIKAVIETDRKLKGATHPLMRRLLLLFILVKYLEDREVFPEDWFKKYSNNASGFEDVLASKNTDMVSKMLNALKTKFNGDIFDISDITVALTSDDLDHFIDFLKANIEKKQFLLWKKYSFKYIPIDVLSHLYQHFAQKDDGAVFTPPFVVDLILDQVMPYKKLTGQETIFDPTCGSGVFLVGAFRRLAYFQRSENNWNRPNVPDLKKIIEKSIFGAELDPDAARVAAFNLALAICDALQPEIIWKDLKFDTLIGRNILIGDVFVNWDRIQNIAGNGFSNILGNPPFKSQLTPAAQRIARRDNVKVPDNQIAYLVLRKCMDLLSNNGCICMIQPRGVLYNNKTQDFFKNFTSRYSVQTLLDFTSIRNLFEGADTKVVAIVANTTTPKMVDRITHLTFRRTKSVHERIGFELDHYDWHEVALSTAQKFPSVWKANILGGGRLLSLSRSLSQYPTMRNFWEKQGWTFGEGFIAGINKNKMRPADWITGKPHLPTSELKEGGINESAICIFDGKLFDTAYSAERFTAPMFLIKENEKLQTAFLRSGYLTFKHKIVSVNAPSAATKELEKFANYFENNKKILKVHCYLNSSQLLLEKSTALLKTDIDNLPYPPMIDEDFQLSWWEQDLVGDIHDYMGEFVRLGQNSKVLTKAVNSDQMSEYGKTFVKLLSGIYSNLRLGKTGSMGGLAYQSFFFGDKCNLLWPDDWDKKLYNLIYKDNSAIFTTRIVRFYEANTLIIIKPDRLRYWIPSTAIWDADEALDDMQKQGF